MKDILLFNHRGLEFTINKEVRSIISRDHPDLLKKYELKSARGVYNGDITRKYAWDSICEELEKQGILTSVFDEIIDRTISGS